MDQSRSTIKITSCLLERGLDPVSNADPTPTRRVLRRRRRKERTGKPEEENTSQKRPMKTLKEEWLDPVILLGKATQTQRMRTMECGMNPSRITWMVMRSVWIWIFP